MVTRTAFGGQLFELLYVAASEHDFVGCQSGDQASDDVCDMAAPLLLPFLKQRLVTDIALVRAFLVREVTQFHGLHDAIHDQRRTESCSKSQEQHLPVPIAAQCLHGCIIDKLHGAAKGRPEVKTKPSFS